LGILQRKFSRRFRVKIHPDAALDSPLTGPSLAPFYPAWRKT
jgi:hypothetical protein